MRAAHQLVDADPKILVDPVAVTLIRKADDNALNVALATHEEPRMRHLRANFVLRNRVAEDRLEEAARRGVSQYLILGAGLDTFGYRQPVWSRGLKVIEVDHPVSQKLKIETLESVRITPPENVSFLSVDFTFDTIHKWLSEAPIDPAEAIFVSWLGVTQYLAHESISSTLRAIASRRGSSEIVLTYIANNWLSLPPDEATAMRMTEMRAPEWGEPWISKFSERSIEDLLATSGFTHVVHVTITSAKERYFNGRSDGLQPSAGTGIVYART